MLFNSVNFLIFFPITILIYYVLPKKAKNIWLLLASYFFYMCWNPSYILLLIFSTLVTYGCARLMAKQEEQSKKKKFVVLCILLNLAVLFFFKYNDFIFENAQYVAYKYLHLILLKPKIDVLLPVGISFYIFQALGYSIDVYRGKVEAEKNLLEYALFVSFFPQLVAGPIERSKDLLSQLKGDKPVDFYKARHGFLIMLWGFFLKLVIADRIGIFVDAVYDNFAEYQGWYLIVATVLFAFQIYCDFYGYSTIAVGAGKMLGVNLTENFNSPYLSTCVKAFWRNWHITLSSWFKDYVYIPLGGNKKSKCRTYLNTLIVFALSGLWHGANWTFVIWGLLNGLFQVVGDIVSKYTSKLKEKLNYNSDLIGAKIIKVITTFILIDFSWIFFRAKSLEDATKVVTSIFTNHNPWILFDGSLFNLGVDANDFIVLAVALLVLLIADAFKKKQIRISEVIERQNLLIRWSVYLIAIFSILIFGIWGSAYDAKSFIYFQF